ncbi:MAG: alpha/beta hydrolase, partial [Bifidobacteriaceae bacterium]|nr:alpha/beta hydrolase [Bifidobacteriaceae bacterium]
MPLDPAIKAVYVSASRRRPHASQDPATERRDALELDRQVVADFTVPVRAIETRDVTVPVPGYPDVRLRLFIPPVAGPLPAYLAFFGGSFRRGGVEWPSASSAFAFRALRTPAITVAVDYALAPEHPYPAAVHQGMAGLEWVAREGAGHGIDPARIAIGGMSSGGNLA